MKEEGQQITFGIKYVEGMDMKELVDEINQNNDAMITAFTAEIQKQNDLILKQMNSRFDEVNQSNKEINHGIGLVNQSFEVIKKHLGIQE